MHLLHNHDRGETSIQTVLLVPIMLTILFVGIHVGSLARAGQVAGLAAFRGAQMAAAADGSAGQTVEVLREIDRTITELGSRASTAPRVLIGPRAVRVSVTVDVEQIVPFLPVSSTRSVTVARETFLREQDR